MLLCELTRNFVQLWYHQSKDAKPQSSAKVKVERLVTQAEFFHGVVKSTDYWSEELMTGEIVVIKRSEIGLGLFATVDIPKGTRIVQYTGQRIPKDDVEKHKGKYLFTLNDKWTIDGKSRTNLARYANHSCRPNAKSITTIKTIWIVAGRKIKAGEEITYNYGKDYFNEFIKPNGCKCVKCKPV